ncbi:hypothetical protein Tco_0370312 [Tanacetum coccineum]
MKFLMNCPLKLAFTKSPSVLYQNLLREFWSTTIAYDPNPPSDNSVARLLKEYLIKFSMMNGKSFTLDFNTFRSSTDLDYNKEKYVAHPNPKAIKTELGKIATNASYLDKTLVLKNSFPMIGYCLITGTEVDIKEIIYSDLITKLLSKSRLKYVSYPRFISFALEVLLGSAYTQDQKFRNLPNIMSNSNFSKDPSRVTEIELTAHMIAVNNQKNSVSPLPFSGKKKKSLKL